MMLEGQEDRVIQLVRSVFDEVVAVGYTREGIESFYGFADAKQLSRRNRENHFTLLAWNGEKLMGIIEIRDLSHVSMFFVHTRCQGRGIGRYLFDQAVGEIRRRSPQPRLELTVNSSPNAVPMYTSLGFAAQGDIQCLGGISFVPMTCSLGVSPKP